jgi:hypothetical protein
VSKKAIELKTCVSYVIISAKARAIVLKNENVLITGISGFAGAYVAK